MKRLMNRRLYVLSIMLLVLLPFTKAKKEEQRVNVWQGTNVRKAVEMTPYLAAGHDNISVVVCPGGSYFWHDLKAEGKAVGEWLQRNGISAFVLRYRTAGFWAYLTRFRYLFRGYRHPDAFNDLHQALTYIRAKANAYNINPHRIGVMGFSAGGHLVMLAGELLSPKERPFFIASIYPVVTMEKKCVHKRSRRALLGDDMKNNISLRHSLSTENHVPKDCPPVFLVNCKDDPIVDFHNAVLLDSALSVNNIPHKYIQYHTGGHGFGAAEHKGTVESRRWKGEFLSWLNEVIKKSIKR